MLTIHWGHMKTPAMKVLRAGMGECAWGWRNHGWSFTAPQMTLDPSFLHPLTSLKLTLCWITLWCTPLCWINKIRYRHPQWGNNEGTRSSPQRGSSYVALWFTAIECCSHGWKQWDFHDITLVYLVIEATRFPEYWVFLKHWGIKDILYFIFLAPLHLIFFS